MRAASPFLRKIDSKHNQQNPFQIELEIGNFRMILCLQSAYSRRWCSQNSYFYIYPIWFSLWTMKYTMDPQATMLIHSSTHIENSICHGWYFLFELGVCVLPMLVWLATPMIINDRLNKPFEIITKIHLIWKRRKNELFPRRKDLVKCF